MPKEFEQALGNFINDVAVGGAIRHLADQDYTVSEIINNLNYPISKSKVASIVWDYYIENGIICFDQPQKYIEKFKYVKEQNSYGKISFRKVIERECIDREYVKVDFGKQLYNNNRLFLEFLKTLSSKDYQYISDLPWPKIDIYHIINPRMTRIYKQYESFMGN